MSDEDKQGSRTAGAQAKGKAAAQKQKDSGKPCKGNPYSNQRPGMRDAWQAAFDAELAGEPTPPKPEKPARKKSGRKPKPQPEPAPIAEEPADEVIEAEPELIED